MLVSRKRCCDHNINNIYIKRVKIAPIVNKEPRSVKRKRSLSPEKQTIPRYEHKIRALDEKPDYNGPHLLISEIPKEKQTCEVKRNINGYVTYTCPSLWANLVDGPDPRDFYATDIQRIYRGWISRKHSKYIYCGDVNLINFLNSMTI